MDKMRKFLEFEENIAETFRWDLFAEDSTYARPTLIYITGGNNIEISGHRQKNPPNVFNSVKGGATNVVFSDLELDATSKSDNPPKNTDGFDVGASTYVTMTNLVVSNDDDCIAFKAGANYVTVDTISCTGSHGISIGSLGKTNADVVSNIYVSNAHMIDSTKASGIKTYPGGSGYGSSTVTNVTFTGFIVDGCDYAIQVQSCYNSDADYCASNPGDVTLTDIHFENYSGTTDSNYEPATSNLDCSSTGTCDIDISSYTVVSPTGSGEVLCANTPSDLGVTCTSGASG
jgi:galacturan 1,4-alpha-galacturonidase